MAKIAEVIKYEGDNSTFDKLIDLMGETEHMNGYANFAYGLRTGILLAFELFANDVKPILRKRQ